MNLLFTFTFSAKTETNAQSEHQNEAHITSSVRTHKRTQRLTRTFTSLVRQPQFHIFELVWAHVKGFPYWPGVIEKVTPRGQFTIHFFGDYTRSNVGRNAVCHFYEGFEQYASHDGNKKLPRAIREARIMLLGDEDVNECLVCRIEKIKMQVLNQGE